MSEQTTRNTGIFITFEGGEGVGKSTQIRLLALRLEAAGIPVLCVREPGGTAVGEAIRSILLDPKNTALSPRAELLLYAAARAQIVDEVIAPALLQGNVVLCDRFQDSTMAYQGIARGLGSEIVDQANQLACVDLTPRRTIVLALEPELSLERAVKRGADRLEGEGLAFHTKVHEGFALIAGNDPERVRIVHTCERKEDTARAVFRQVADLFPQVSEEDFEITPQMIAGRSDVSSGDGGISDRNRATDGDEGEHT